MSAKALAAKVRRWAGVVPPARIACRTRGYADGAVTTATLAWFFAAARTIGGPVEVRARGDRLAERVQVGHQQVERRDPQLGQLLGVRGVPRVGREPRVDVRVQGLAPPVQRLRDPGQLPPPGHRYAQRLDPPRR